MWSLWAWDTVGTTWHEGGPGDVEPRAPEAGRGTCDEGGHAPAQHVVEAHGAGVDIAHLGESSVQVQGLQQGPGEGAEEQEVQQDGDDCASKLRAQATSAAGAPPERGFWSCRAKRARAWVLGGASWGDWASGRHFGGTGEVKGAREEETVSQARAGLCRVLLQEPGWTVKVGRTHRGA